MKNFICALICGLLLMPSSAWGQKWIWPYTDKDGKKVEGHWQTPEEARKERYPTPEQNNPHINHYTGQYTPFSGQQPVPPATPGSTPPR